MGAHKGSSTSSAVRWTMLVLSLLVLSGFGWWWVSEDEPVVSPLPNPVIGSQTPSVTTLPTPSGTPVIGPTPTSRPTKRPQTEPFVPVSVSVAQIGSRDVQSLPRITVGDNGFSLPDPQGANPSVFAWDREGARPGSTRGAVNLLAHTYPPGQTALGNQLFDVLQVGDIIIVRGLSDSLGYRVVERMQADVADYPADRVLDTDGKSVLTITICSGERLGPGNWTMRTVWFAEPLK